MKIHNVSKHRVLSRQSSREWEDGFPIGNGILGAMVWGDGNPLSFTLDRCDIWDTRNNADYLESPDFTYANLCRLISCKRFDEVDEIFEQKQLRDNPIGPTKISIGRFELRLGEAVAYDCSLDIDDAVFCGNIETRQGIVRIESFVHHDKNVLCLRIKSAAVKAKIQFVPLAKTAQALAELKHPAPLIDEKGGMYTCLQEIPGGLFYALAWNTCGPEFYISAETSGSADDALKKAMSLHAKAVKSGYKKLRAEHIKKWHAFWSESRVCLPEAKMEFFWYYGIYLLASSAKKGNFPPGLQGLWAMDGVIPPWRGDYHSDMNVQETFWPACASGHLDLLDCWCDYMKACIEPAKEFTSKFFGTEGTFWPCSTIPTFIPVRSWHTCQFAWSSTGWIGSLVWMRWRYSMDIEWLRETGYPVMAEIFRFFNSNLKLEQDGFLHIPLSSSPEYADNTPAAWCKDPNIDIAVIRKCCDWIVEMEKALKINALAVAAKETHEKLVPYSLTEKKELCLWPGKPLDESHRHPSHLMAIHPMMDMTIDDGENIREIIDASIQQYLSLGQYRWAGHSYAQLASFAAVLGRGGWAYECLKQFVEHWVGPNGLYFNRDMRNSGMSFFTPQNTESPGKPFTMESNCGINAGISDMLVQGWGDVLRIFPAMPDNWRDAAFFNLLTEGAYRVSALYRHGQTIWVKITAGVDGRLKLRNPFGAKKPKAKGCRITCDAELLTADLKQGQTIELYFKDNKFDFAKEVSEIRQSDYSLLSLK